MIIFALKMFNNLRKAVAGRRYPHQMAGAVALGLLLGLIPHGNLLALAILIFVLCCRVNHALLAMVAIGVTFVATKLDPYSHQLGQYVLGHEKVIPVAEKAWTLPLVPWTDLNNTIVMGSFLIGAMATLPVFLLTLPIFKLIQPKPQPEADETEQAAASDSAVGVSSATTRVDSSETTSPPALPRVEPLVPSRKTVVSSAATHADEDATSVVMEPIPFDSLEDSGLGNSSLDGEAAYSTDPAESSESKHSIKVVHDAHRGATPPRFSPPKKPVAPEPIPFDTDDFFASDDEVAKKQPADQADSKPTDAGLVSVDTRIDVIRMQATDADGPKDPSGPASGDEQHMDEALSYLLQQLRNSQQRKAAG